MHTIKKENNPSAPASYKGTNHYNGPAEDILKAATRVLHDEANAIVRMSNTIPADFVSTVTKILSCQGRVIVSGIGKSGHIARKISSTLASTGTPSTFVHPSEASHGDLGMVTRQDICILISNSGETTELGDLIAHTRRFGIPLIGISRNEQSSLMCAADLCLTIPPEPEACTIGMVPTTSTTLTLALGDALAVALMGQRGFLKEDFHAFHPGGRLGAQLTYVHQLMDTDASLPLVKPDTPMGDTIIMMSAKGFGIACVIDEQKTLIGVISDGDLRRHIDGLMQKTAQDVATLRPKTISSNSFALEAVNTMNNHKIASLIVTDSTQKVVGLLRLHECLRAGIV